MRHDRVINKKNSQKWYKDRGYTAVMNVPVTPGSLLKKTILRNLTRQGLSDRFNLMIREVPGQRVQHKLSNVTKLNREGKCERLNCLPCSSAESGSKGACWRSNPTYQIKCATCRDEGNEAVYTGESGYTSFTRAGLHLEGLRKEDGRSALWEHAVLQHGAEKGDGKKMMSNFTMKVLGSHKSPSLRLISEAIEIENQIQRREMARRERSTERGEIMVLNSVKQWYQPSLVRIKAKQRLEY